jgi:3-hydroxybutyryl-CoA dehydrogenase
VTLDDRVPLTVVGSGRQAGEVAAAAARSGHLVQVVGDTASDVDDTRGLAAQAVDELVAAGAIPELERAEVLGNIIGVDGDAPRGAALVVEARAGTVEAKGAAVRRISASAPATLIATTTNLQSVSAIAAHGVDPTLVAGVHFVGPAHLSGVVEVIRAQRTADRAAQAVCEFVAGLGKDAIEVKDRPGFLVQRLQAAYLNDVIQCYDDGLASAADLDVALELGLGYPTGPLRLLDEIGLDAHAATTEALYEALGDVHFAPPALLTRMVEAGDLGVKAGRGFRTGDASEDGE